MKCKQLRQKFELRSPRPFPAAITLTRACMAKSVLLCQYVYNPFLLSSLSLSLSLSLRLIPCLSLPRSSLLSLSHLPSLFSLSLSLSVLFPVSPFLALLFSLSLTCPLFSLSLSLSHSLPVSFPVSPFLASFKTKPNHIY